MPINQIKFRKASTQQWVGISERDPSDEDGIALLGTPNGNLTFLYEDIPGQGWDNNRLSMWEATANDLMTVRIDRSTLPADHPYIVSGDPALDWLYWDGTDVVEKRIIIENSTYDPSTGLLFNVVRIWQGIP